MKKVFIDGKEHWQQEASDIKKLPSQNFDKDILKKYNWDKTLSELKEKMENK